jgi:hypothetical protein
MIQLTHDKNFVAELSQPCCCIDKAEIEALHSVLDTGCLVYNQAHDSGNTRSQHGTIQDTSVNFCSTNLYFIGTIESNGTNAR